MATITGVPSGLTLPVDAHDALQELRRRHGTSIDDEVGRAILFSKVLDDLLTLGGKLRVEIDGELQDLNPNV